MLFFSVISMAFDRCSLNNYILTYLLKSRNEGDLLINKGD